jgi:hypothetical protein
MRPDRNDAACDQRPASQLDLWDLRDTYTNCNADRKPRNTDTDTISDGYTSDPHTYANTTHTHTNADTTHTYADPESGDNTDATASHPNADAKSGDHTEPNSISDGDASDADTNTDSAGAGR